MQQAVRPDQAARNPAAILRTAPRRGAEGDSPAGSAPGAPPAAPPPLLREPPASHHSAPLPPAGALPLAERLLAALAANHAPVDSAVLLTLPGAALAEAALVTRSADGSLTVLLQPVSDSAPVSPGAVSSLRDRIADRLRPSGCAAVRVAFAQRKLAEESGAEAEAEAG